MIKISRESEVNLINVLIDRDVISGKDLPNIKKASHEGEKTQLEAVFDLKLTDEDKILDLLVKDQNLDVIDKAASFNVATTGDDEKVEFLARIAALEDEADLLAVANSDLRRENAFLREKIASLESIENTDGEFLTFVFPSYYPT